MKKLPFMLVDAFAERAMTGNPAGIVFCDTPLSDAQMRAMAREVNASETSFLTDIQPDGSATLRWFTPRVEMDFCGHATVAAAHALYARSRASNRGDGQLSYRFSTRSGVLPVTGEIAGDATADAPLWWLEMPVPKLEPARVNALKLANVLGCALDDFDTSIPMLKTRAGVLIVFVSSWQILANLRPNFGALAEWCFENQLRDVGVSTTKTLSPMIHASSRFFAPVCGIDEDPVTGTLHGPLCRILAEHNLAPHHEGIYAMNCLQGIPDGRGGKVVGLVDTRESELRVKIAGKCWVSIEGEICVPEEGV
ncbi:MAG: PhzF family phenazine biosynthesis protein [Phycisphaerae bacterium]